MAGGAIDVAAAQQREAKRVARILRGDRIDAASERARQDAVREVKAGKLTNIAAATLGPTPEHAAKVPFEPYTADKVDGTVRNVETVRRVSANRVKQLYDRGVLGDDTYPACLWYQRTWEAGGFVMTASAGSWGDTVRGDPCYGHGPKTPRELEARHNFRHARGFIPDDMVVTFDLVILHEHTIQEAATMARCRFSNAQKMVTYAASRLLEGAAAFLPVRGGRVMGSVPGGAEIEDLGLPDRMISLDRMIGVVGTLSPVDPEFLDDRGLMRPWVEISEIIRGRLAGKV